MSSEEWLMQWTAQSRAQSQWVTAGLAQSQLIALGQPSHHLLGYIQWKNEQERIEQAKALYPAWFEPASEWEKIA
jgi:hypothetical protein